MRDTMNFNGNLLLAPPSSLEPTFMAEYDKSGTYITSTIFPAGGDDVSDIATDNRGNFYVGGDYSFHSIVIGPDTLRYTSSEQLYIAKYKYDITDCGGIIGPLQSVPISASPILLYPNPSKSELTITSPEKINQISISNLLGQTVFTHEYNADEVQVDVTNLPAGMYLFKINNAVVRKFRKQ